MIDAVILPIAFGCAAVIAVVIVVHHSLEVKVMGINDELSAIRDSLVEASTEIVSKIAGLEDAVAAGDPVDASLLAEVRSAAEGLANIVPDEVEPGDDLTDNAGASLKPIVPGSDLTDAEVSGAGGHLTDDAVQS